MKSIPVPTPSIEYYDIFDKGMKRFPERKRNYSKYIESKKNNFSSIDFLPIKLDIENTNRCNLFCNMCVNSKLYKKKYNILSFDFFCEIIDELNSIHELKIQGIGEPFTQGDEFIKMVSYAHSKDIWVRTTTNATLLKTQNFYKKIIDAGIGEIQISVDGVTKDTYEKIRKGAQFEKVVENCNLINDYCNSKNLTKTRMWVLIQKDNFKELKSFPKFASKMGFKRLTFALDIHDWGTNNLVDVKRKQIVLSAKDICELIELGKRYNIDISIWQNQNAKYSNDNLCPWPFERFFIMSDKKILPCCMIGSSKVFSLGDLHKKTLKDIWFSKTYTVFRNRHLTNNIPEICKNCYVRSDN